MENWRNQQIATAALEDTTKKIAALDLCTLIDKNINRDPAKCLDEAVAKKVAEELKLIKYNKNPRHRNKRNKANTDKVDNTKTQKSALKQKSGKRKTREVKKAGGSETDRTSMTDPNPAPNEPKRAHFNTMQQG